MNTYNSKQIEVFTSTDPKLLDAKFKQFMENSHKYDSVTRSGNRITAYPTL